MFRDRTTISRSSRYRCLGIFFRSDTEIYSSLCRLKSPEPVRSSSLRPRPSIIPDQAEAWEEPQSWQCGSACFNCPDHASCHGLSPRQRKASSNCHRPGKDNRVAVMPTYRQDVRTRSYCQSQGMPSLSPGALGLFECADTPRAVYLLGLRVEGSRRRHADESYGKIASPHFLLPRFAPPIVSDL